MPRTIRDYKAAEICDALSEPIAIAQQAADASLCTSELQGTGEEDFVVLNFGTLKG
jgi:hypothetical protein